jgi:hypothetical protein
LDFIADSYAAVCGFQLELPVQPGFTDSCGLFGAEHRRSRFYLPPLTLHATYPKGRTVHPHPTITSFVTRNFLNSLNKRKSQDHYI